MATGPPPDATTAASRDNQHTSSTTIPITERIPRLTSSQYRFTTANAIRNLDSSQRNVYRIVVKLTSRAPATFARNNPEGVPWTFAVKDFLKTIQIYDAQAMILPRRENAKINKLCSQDDVPESTDDFERDYAWNPRSNSPKDITFTIMISTTKAFLPTFKRGSLFDRLKDNKWYVNLDRLETQEMTSKVGVFLYAHIRWANQEEILDEIKELLAPTICTDMDVRVDRPSRKYYAKSDTIVISHGRQECQTIRTRWPALFAPMDIATELKSTLGQRWPLLQTDPRFANFNCRRYIFIPDTPTSRHSRRNNSMTEVEQRNYSNYLHYMRKQNIFLNTCSQVVVLQNVGNIYANFEWTASMAEHINSSLSNIGKKQPLRTFLANITRSANPNDRTIHSIHRDVQKGTWTLLVSKDDAQELRETIDKLVPMLQATPAFAGIRVGGTNGAYGSERYDTNSIGYLAALGTSTEYVCEPTILDAGGDSTMTSPSSNDINYNVPPAGRTAPRGTVAARVVRPSAANAIMNYSDVLKSVPHSNPYQPSTSSTSTLTASSSTYNNSTSLSRATSTEPSINMDSLFQNQQFKQMMADVIAPHLQPALQEVSNMKASMAAMQTKTANIEANVASIASLGPKFDHLLGVMTTMSQQMSATSPLTQASSQERPQKKHCGNSTTSHDGPSTPREDFFLAPYTPIIIIQRVRKKLGEEDEYQRNAIRHSPPNGQEDT
jgi:hypothetical protein